MKPKFTIFILAAFFMISCNSSKCVISGKTGSDNCSTVILNTADTQSECKQTDAAFAELRAHYSGTSMTYTCKATWE